MPAQVVRGQSAMRPQLLCFLLLLGATLMLPGVVTGSFARIAKPIRIHRNEFPLITLRPEGELQHAIGIKIPYLTVGYRRSQRIVASSTRTHNNLASSVLLVGISIRILRGKPL